MWLVAGGQAGTNAEGFPDLHAGRKFGAQLTDKFAIFRTVQLLADCYEQAVSTHPTDWHMLQRVWLDDLDPSKAPTS